MTVWHKCDIIIVVSLFPEDVDQKGGLKMGKKIDERTLQMIENYERLWRMGYTPTRVAKEYDLSRRTVYNYLPMIAEKIGVPREDLLEVPHSEHISYERRYEPVELIDLTEFREHFNLMEKAFNQLDSDIEKTISVAEQEEEDER